MIALVDENGAAELHDDRTVLFEASGFDGDNAHVGTGFGLAFAQNFSLGIESVAFEDRGGNGDFFPAKIDGESGHIGG